MHALCVVQATKHELAVVYNDVSVLENHHVAAAFKLLKNKDLDWTRNMPLDDYKDFRETVVQMVLGTDMRAHFEHLTKFKSKLAGDGFAKEGGLDRKDTRLLLTMALHAADICNPAKPVPIATTWARRSMDEFFKQGDKEVHSRRTRRRAVPYIRAVRLLLWPRAKRRSRIATYLLLLLT